MMFNQIIAIGVQNNCAKSLGAGRAQDASVAWLAVATTVACVLLGAILGKVYGETGVWTAFVLAEILTLASFIIIIALRKKAIVKCNNLNC